MSPERPRALDFLKSPPNTQILRDLRNEQVSFLDELAKEANSELHLQPHQRITGEDLYSEFKELLKGFTPIVHPNGQVDLISENPQKTLNRREFLRQGLSVLAVGGPMVAGGGYGIVLNAILSQRRSTGPDIRYVLGGAILGALVGWGVLRSMITSKESIDAFEDMITTFKDERQLNEIKARLSSAQGNTPQQIHRSKEILRHVAELIQIDSALASLDEKAKDTSKKLA